jgi:hypothetical protein
MADRTDAQGKRVAQLREEYCQAAADPDFLQDIDKTMRDFATSDAETASMIPWLPRTVLSLSGP